jgi:two-component system phosphate regulon sensor histidine kinase PhoR
MAEGVLLLNAAGRLVLTNPAGRAMLRLPEKADDTHYLEMVRQPDIAALTARALGGERPPAVEVELVPGSRHAFVAHVVPVDAARGGGAVLVLRDITDLRRADQVRRDFVANVSHELRTPLTVLAGFLETIQDLKLDASRVRDYVGLMAPQAERMKHLIDDLLTLSSLEHAPPPPAAERIVLRTLLERVRAEAQGLSAGKHRISLEATGGYDLLGAEAEIMSAFVNLVSNAVRYTPAGGEIRLRWNSADAGGEFTVEDTGIGIDPEHLPRLTERFYRVDRGRSRETGGTGLGLSIVRHALARHQAALAIDSIPGKGSRFSVRFPPARLTAAEQTVVE